MLEEGTKLSANFSGTDSNGYTYSSYFIHTTACLIFGNYVIITSIGRANVSTIPYAILLTVLKREGLELSVMNSKVIYLPSHSTLGNYSDYLYNHNTIALTKFKNNKFAVHICLSYSLSDTDRYNSSTILFQLGEGGVFEVIKNVYNYRESLSGYVSSILLLNDPEGNFCIVTPQYYPSYASISFTTPVLMDENGTLYSNANITSVMKQHRFSSCCQISDNTYLIVCTNSSKDAQPLYLHKVVIDFNNNTFSDEIITPNGLSPSSVTPPIMLKYNNRIYIIQGGTINERAIWEYLINENTLLLLSSDNKVSRIFSNVSSNTLNNITFIYEKSDNRVNISTDMASVSTKSITLSSSSRSAYYLFNEIPIDRWLPDTIIVDDSDVTSDNLYGITQSTCKKNKKGKVVVPLT